MWNISVKLSKSAARKKTMFDIFIVTVLKSNLEKLGRERWKIMTLTKNAPYKVQNIRTRDAYTIKDVSYCYSPRTRFSWRSSQVFVTESIRSKRGYLFKWIWYCTLQPASIWSRTGYTSSMPLWVHSGNKGLNCRDKHAHVWSLNIGSIMLKKGF